MWTKALLVTVAFLVLSGWGRVAHAVNPRQADAVNFQQVDVDLRTLHLLPTKLSAQPVETAQPMLAEFCGSGCRAAQSGFVLGDWSPQNNGLAVLPALILNALLKGVVQKSWERLVLMPNRWEAMALAIPLGAGVGMLVGGLEYVWFKSGTGSTPAFGLNSLMEVSAALGAFEVSSLLLFNVDPLSIAHGAGIAPPPVPLRSEIDQQRAPVNRPMLQVPVGMAFNF